MYAFLPPAITGLGVSGGFQLQLEDRGGVGLEELEKMVQEITGVKVVALHHDISTTTCEEVVLFTLAEAPATRETRKR